MRVTEGSEGSAALAGRYIASRDGLEFHPREPFEAGRAYLVRFDPTRLPAPRSDGVIEATLVRPLGQERPPAVVTSISPTTDVWPANVQRFYVHFSAPMARTEGLPFVRVLDDRGENLEGVFVPSAIDFWNADRTRYTGFLTGGSRATAGGPDRSGRPFDEGREYTLVVDAAWRDADGRPLAESHRKTFRAGPPVNEPLVPANWRIAVPATGTTDSIVVTFPRALDVGLLDRSLAVATAGGSPLEGTVTLAGGDSEWRFAPARAWRRGPYELIVLSTLEDPAGNRIGRAADLATSNPEDEPAPAQALRLPFVVK
jgi:hypothetical protein